jgi:hypothetical protein
MSNTFASAIARYWAQHPDFLAQATASSPSLAAHIEGSATTAEDCPTLLPLRTALFDMDGVLFDSMPAHAKSWAQVCREFCFDVDETEIYMNEGRTAFTTLNVFTQRQYGRDTTPEEVEKIYQRKCEVFNTFPSAPKMPGAQELLDQIAADELTRVVVTGSGQASLLERITRHYPNIFDTNRIVSSLDVKHGKPDPEPYLMGLNKADVQPWEAIVVENAPLGVRASVAAGIFTIAVNTGPLPESALLDEGANLLFPSMQAFAEAWPQLRNFFALTKQS